MSETAAAPSSPARKWLRRSLPLVGLALLGWVVSRQDLGEMARALKGASPIALVVGPSLFALNLLIKSVRWWRLLAAQGTALPLSQAMKAFLSANFFGTVTLGRVGEFLRMGVLLKRGVSPGAALASCVFDRLLDLFTLSIIGGIFGAWVLGNERFALVAGISIAALFPIGVVVARRSAKWLSGIDIDALPRGFLRRPVRIIRDLVLEAPALLGARTLAEAAGWTMLAWAGYLANILILTHGLSIAAPATLIIGATSFAALSALLPITYQGVGVREVIFSVALARADVPEESSVTLALLLFASMLTVTVILGATSAALGRDRNRQDVSLTADTAQNPET